MSLIKKSPNISIVPFFSFGFVNMFYVFPLKITYEYKKAVIALASKRPLSLAPSVLGHRFRSIFTIHVNCLTMNVRGLCTSSSVGCMFTILKSNPNQSLFTSQKSNFRRYVRFLYYATFVYPFSQVICYAMILIFWLIASHIVGKYCLRNLPLIGCAYTSPSIIFRW